MFSSNAWFLTGQAVCSRNEKTKIFQNKFISEGSKSERRDDRKGRGRGLRNMNFVNY
jgi:hypothetical protein